MTNYHGSSCNAQHASYCLTNSPKHVTLFLWHFRNSSVEKTRFTILSIFYQLLLLFVGDNRVKISASSKYLPDFYVGAHVSFTCEASIESVDLINIHSSPPLAKSGCLKLGDAWSVRSNLDNWLFRTITSSSCRSKTPNLKRLTVSGNVTRHFNFKSIFCSARDGHGMTHFSKPINIGLTKGESLFHLSENTIFHVNVECM